MNVRETAQRSGRTGILTAAAALLLGGFALGAGACGSDNADGELPDTSATGGAGGEGGGGTGEPTPCDDEGATQSCNVKLNEDNCFVGVQTCVDGLWSECGPGDVSEAALSTTAVCDAASGFNNPCNPTCQFFDETPPQPIGIPGTGVPAGGTVDGLPPGIASQGLQDPCAASDDCQFDHFCNGSNVCEPWATGDHNMSGALPDLTMPVPCDGQVWVCNRGNAVAPAGVQVNVINGNTGNLNLGGCTGASGGPGSTCTTVSDILPGQCLNVPGCAALLSPGNDTLVVNSQDYAGAAFITESNCDNNWTVDHNQSGACQCSASQTAAGVVEVNMFIAFDNSGSMGPSYNDLWDPAVAGMTAFITDPLADPLNVALRFYDSCDCSPSPFDPNCAIPAVPLGSLDTLVDPLHEGNLVAAILAEGPGGGTPHNGSVAGACDWAITTSQNPINAGDQEVVVYMSDGQTESGCGNGTGAIAAADAAFLAEGVLTFTIALPGADTTLLQNIANAGRGAMIDVEAEINAWVPPGDPTDNVDIGIAITDAMVDIQNSVVPCELTVPNISEVDTSTLQIEYFPNGTPPPRTLTQVSGAGMCGMTPPVGAADQFFLATPTTVEMCTDVCNEIRGDLSAIVEVTGECLGGFTTTTVAMEDYQSACMAPSLTSWDFFVYDTDLDAFVGNTSTQIEFQARAAATQAGLASESWVTIRTATPTMDWDATYGGLNYVDLNAALGFASQSEWMELQAIITPSDNGTSSPVINSWDVAYSCPVAE